ncbi:MAG TPA: hypothetical protein VGJ93_15580 [Desulfuromonadaceae bacterium]|jgi:hypothetical protein
MNKMKISTADLIMEIEDCRAMACFLSEAIGLILGEHSGFTEKCPVPHGAATCLDSLADKLGLLLEKI